MTKKFYKQTRADGTEYYSACVEIPRRTFFGLIPTTEVLWVHETSKGFILDSEEEYHVWFKTIYGAECGLKEAMELYQSTQLHDTVIKFEEIKRDND